MEKWLLIVALIGLLGSLAIMGWVTRQLSGHILRLSHMLASKELVDSLANDRDRIAAWRAAGQQGTPPWIANRQINEPEDLASLQTESGLLVRESM